MDHPMTELRECLKCLSPDVWHGQRIFYCNTCRWSFDPPHGPQTEEQLVAAWNTRTPEAEDANDIEALHNCLNEEAETDLADIAEELAGALEPFKAIADEIDRLAKKYGPPYDDPVNWSKTCQWEDLMTARAALSRYRNREGGNGTG